MRPIDRRAFVLGAGAVALAWPTRARAGELVAELRASSTALRVGDELELELELRREGGGSVPDPELPDGLAEGFEIVSKYSSGSGFQISLGGGRNTRTVHSSMAIAAVALKPGTYKLSFTADDGGSKITSNVVEVVVEGEARAPEPAVATTGKPTEPRGDIFVWTATDKATAYVGEQLEYRLDVYDRSMRSTVTLRTPPSFADFYTYDLPEGEAVIEEVAGVRYTVRPGMRRALFPQKAGTLTIGAPEITIGRRRRDRAPALSIEVRPLPAEGQPPGFSPNNVGTFTVTTKVDRDRVEVGQPFTWTVEIAGEGNVALVDPGQWPELAGARRYDPKVDSQMRADNRVTGRRSYAFLVIPEVPGRLALPAIELDYFDPAQAKYTRARSEALAVEVVGTALPAAAEPPAPGDEARDDDPGFAPILVGDTLPRDAPPSPWLTAGRWSSAMVALPTVAAAWWAGAALWRRYGPDDAARRRTEQRRRRRERLEAARDAVDSGEGFHAALATLLHDLAVARVGVEGTGLPRPELLRLLERRGTATAEVRKLESMLERCDAARFAAQRGTVEERRDLLEDALALVERSSLAHDEHPRGER